MFCPVCGSTVPSDSKYCPRCGSLLPDGSDLEKFGFWDHKDQDQGKVLTASGENQQWCPKCGRAMKPGQPFCYVCEFEKTSVEGIARPRDFEKQPQMKASPSRGKIWLFIFLLLIIFVAVVLILRVIL